MKDSIVDLEKKFKRFHERERVSSAPESYTSRPIRQEYHPVIPQFNPVEWKDFRALLFRKNAPAETYAIDILVGEPRFGDSDSLLAQPVSESAQIVKLKKSSLVCTEYDGPLPERIRINSKPLIRILEKIRFGPVSPDLNPVLISAHSGRWCIMRNN